VYIVLVNSKVYFGECVSARVSYFEVSVNDGERIKTKNAGMCVSTGTGSTSWAYNISKISQQTVESLCDIMKQEEFSELVGCGKTLIDGVARQYNSKLIFHPGTP